MKKIIFSIGSLEGGGAEKVLLTVANHLCGRYDITIQTIYNEGLYREALDHRIHYRSIVKRPTLNKKRIIHRLITYLPASWTYRWFVGGDYDVSIAFLEGISSKLVSGANKSIKKISWIHTDLRRIKSRIAGFWGDEDQQRCYNRYDKIICVSQDAKSAFIQAVKPEKMPEVINNPIDREAILSLSQQPWDGLKKKRFTFCTVGRIVDVKAMDRIIKSAATLIKDGLYCDVWIVGEGDEKDNLQKLAKELSVESYIKFLGFLKNPYPVMQIADVYVCSSKHEGYPLTVAEALVLGIPVIATRCTGPREILENGTYGLLAENSDSGIYSAMKCLMEDNETLSELRQKALKRGESFDVKEKLQTIQDLIDHI